MPMPAKHDTACALFALFGATVLIATGCGRPVANAAAGPRASETGVGQAAAGTGQPDGRPPGVAATRVSPREESALGKPSGDDAASKIKDKKETAQQRPSRLLARTFDDIKFDIEPDAPFHREMLTKEIEQLNGQKIEIRGYILPGAQSKLRDFVLVRDNQECCFGPGAALYDCILVSMTPGKVADFSVRPIAVTGEFRIEPFEFGGVTRAVFRMTAEEVKR